MAGEWFPVVRKPPDPDPKPAPADAEHVHEWTEYPSGKRKCKPCGAVERPERNE